MQVQMQKIVT